MLQDDDKQPSGIIGIIFMFALLGMIGLFTIFHWS